MMRKIIILPFLLFSLSSLAEVKESVITIERTDKSIERLLNERWGVVFPMSTTFGVGFSKDSYSFKEGETGSNSGVSFIGAFQFHMKRFGGGLELLYSKIGTTAGEYWDDQGGSRKAVSIKLSYRAGKNYTFETGYNVLDHYKISNASLQLTEVTSSSTTKIHNVDIPMTFKGAGFYFQGSYRINRKMGLAARFTQATYRESNYLQKDEYPDNIPRESTVSTNLPERLMIRSLALYLNYSIGIY